MLRVTLEIVPFGIEAEAKEIGTMLIANDGTGNAGVGNYVFTYTENDAQYNGTVIDFPRSMGAWELVMRCLSTYDIITEDHEFEILELLEKRLK